MPPLKSNQKITKEVSITKNEAVKKSYQKEYNTLRKQYLDVDTIKQSLICEPFGIDKLLLVGIEFRAYNADGQSKPMFIAVNCNGDAILFFERYNPKALAIFKSENNKKIKIIIPHLFDNVSNLIENMHLSNSILPLPDHNFINFFAISYNGKFYKYLTQKEVELDEHPYYPFYFHLKQIMLLIQQEMREKQQKQQKQKKKS